MSHIIIPRPRGSFEYNQNQLDPTYTPPTQRGPSMTDIRVSQQAADGKFFTLKELAAFVQEAQKAGAAPDSRLKVTMKGLSGCLRTIETAPGK